MELFLGSFVIIMLSCAALMVGQFFGRDPISGSCSTSGHCSHTSTCKLECAFRRGREPEGGGS
jgi:hypothetical protein